MRRRQLGAPSPPPLKHSSRGSLRAALPPCRAAGSRARRGAAGGSACPPREGRALRAPPPVGSVGGTACASRPLLCCRARSEAFCAYAAGQRRVRAARGAGRRAGLRGGGQAALPGTHAAQRAGARALTPALFSFFFFLHLRRLTPPSALQREPRTYAAFLALLAAYRADQAGAVETHAAVARLFRRTHADLATAFARFLPADVAPPR